MIVLVLFGALVSNLINANLSYEDCKELSFVPKACAIQEELYKLDQELL